jgi:hypothetical protein
VRTSHERFISAMTVSEVSSRTNLTTYFCDSAARAGLPRP